jgi:hypothetical protein
MPYPEHRKHLTFLLRAHGVFNGRIFNVPSRVNLYNLSNTGEPFTADKSAYDVIFNDFNGIIDWPAVREDIVENLQNVYKQKRTLGWDWKSIQLKHVRGVDGDDNTSVSQLSFKDATFRPDYDITTVNEINDAPTGLIHIENTSDAKYGVQYQEGNFTLSQIVQDVVNKYRMASEIHIICMFCRTLPDNLNAFATNAFEKVTRMLSAEPPGRTSTDEKREILNGLHAATLFSLGPGQEVFYKVQKRTGFDYGRGVIDYIEHDDDSGGETRLYLIPEESGTIKTIGLDNVISHAEWLFDTKQSGGVRRPHAKTTTSRRRRPRATSRSPPSTSPRSPRTSPRASPARTSQYRAVVPQVGPRRNARPYTSPVSPRRNHLRDFSPRP